MINVILVGSSGKMGAIITESIEKHDDINILYGIDLVTDVTRSYPTFDNIYKVEQKADVIIDFSNPDTTDSVLNYALETSTPLIICTTALSEKQTQNIYAAAAKIPVFFSFNMSMGINLLLELSKKAANILGTDFDIEIIEQHHNQKIDAPSGTAYMIASEINNVRDNKMQYVYDRHTTRGKRKSNEIGIHSVRGGTIVGEHEVVFAGKDEVIKISHSAYSRQVFATGAINAARFIVDKPAGLYSMKNLIK